MKYIHKRNTLQRSLTLAVAMSFLSIGDFSLVSESHARKSADRRKVKKLKKDLRRVKRQVSSLRSLNGSLSTRLQAALDVDPAPLSHFPVEMVTVGDDGNPADTLTGFGEVSEEFKISKFEITNAQYAVFLNAIASEDTNGVYDTDMGDQDLGGILRVGTSGNYRYAVKTGMADKPVNFISFWMACRFCNWLHNGRPTGAHNAGTTEGGAYDLSDPADITSNSVVREAGAKFHLPSEDQWYKAAYYQPAGSGGDSDGYWTYPTRSNTTPDQATADVIGDIDNDTSNIANYWAGADWDAGFDGDVNNGTVTTVGSGGLGSSSHYGCFDMAGNVWEWNESVINTIRRGIRGGSWKLETSNDWMAATSRYQFLAGSTVSNVGFRVVEK